MKKWISALLALALALTLSGGALASGEQAALSAQRFVLNGAPAELPAVNIDGYNYIRLRDLAAALSGTACQFSVDYDAARGAVVLTTGRPYVPAEDAPAEDAPADLRAPGVLDTLRSASQTLEADGKALTDLHMYNIAGNTFYRLAELEPVLGFSLRYDADTDTVYLDTPDAAAEASAPVQAERYEDVVAHFRAGRFGGYYDGVMENAEAEEDGAAEPAEAPAPAPAAGNASAQASAAAAEDTGGRGADADYSGTNVQVSGIDEGDIVKTDGSYLYILNGDFYLTVVKADGPDTEVVSQTRIGLSEYTQDEAEKSYSGAHKYPVEMFVSDGVLAVLSNYSSYMEYVDGDGNWNWENSSYLSVDFFDVSNPAAPASLGALGQEGGLLSSRLKDGQLYVVSSYWVWGYDAEDPESYVPRLYENGAGRAMPADCIYLCPEDSNHYVVVCAYDLASGALLASRSLLGEGEQVYMSAGNLYVLGSTWDEETGAPYSESVYTVTDYVNRANTAIYRFALDDTLTLAASGVLPGAIDSQFSVDERDGLLRIVTTEDVSTYQLFRDEEYDFTNYRWGENTSSSGLYILDADLNVVGSVTGLAEDEYVYSVRFDGDVAYFCTFRTVDPLFAVDLSVPEAPEVLSALKLTGFSEYLHPWGENLLFGLGREADEESGRSEGLKLVMFDTGDKADVTVAHTFALPEAYYSAALYNHKAVFIVPEKNLIGFPAGDDGYYLFSYNETEGFQLLRSFGFDTYEWNVRGLYIGDWAYIAGNEELMVLDMRTWDEPIAVNISTASLEEAAQAKG